MLLSCIDLADDTRKRNRKKKKKSLIIGLECLDVGHCVMMLSRFGGTLSVSHLDIDAQRGLVWVIDVNGSVWFTTDVSALHPEGSGCWWQVLP